MNFWMALFLCFAGISLISLISLFVFGHPPTWYNDIPPKNFNEVEDE